MPLFAGISKLSRCEIIVLTDAISLSFTEGLDVDDQNVLGNLLVAIGSVIMTLASLKPAQDPASLQSSGSGVVEQSTGAVES